MSKGTKITPLRLDNAILAIAYETIFRRNAHSSRAPWTLTEFIRVAIREKVSKMKRSRARHSRKKIRLSAAAQIPT